MDINIEQLKKKIINKSINPVTKKMNNIICHFTKNKINNLILKNLYTLKKY